MAAGFREFLLQIRINPVEDGGARDQQQIAVGRHQLLVMPKNLPEAAFGAVSLDGGANGGG